MGKYVLRILGLATFAGLALAPAALLAAPLANVSVTATGLQIDPVVSVDGLQLTVAGPNDFYFRQTFDAGAPIFVPFAANLADGTYAYELVRLATPHNRTRSIENGDLQAEGFRQGGDFSILAGLGVAPTLAERLPQKDIVQADDVIVEGNVCAGSGCVDGEVFGSDLLRLKDDQLRIHFEDTTGNPSLPGNDWRIVINDTVSGGANYFGIEDATAGLMPFRIGAGAPADALYVDDGGDVGVGTNVPVRALHVSRNSTPAIRLEQTGSSSTPQTWEIVANHESFSIWDASNGDLQPFTIEPGVESPAFHIAASGQIGMGTSTPQAPLDVRKTEDSSPTLPSNVIATFQDTSAGASVVLVSADDSNAQILMGDTDNVSEGRIVYRNAADAMSFEVTDDEIMRITTDGLCVGCTSLATGSNLQVSNGSTTSRMTAGDASFTVTSSRAAKENLSSVEDVGILEKITGIEVFTYDYIDGPDDRLGLIAEDFHQVFGRGSDTTINGQEVQMALWLAVQELTAQNKALVERLEKIEAAAKK